MRNFAKYNVDAVRLVALFSMMISFIISMHSYASAQKWNEHTFWVYDQDQPTPWTPEHFIYEIEGDTVIEGETYSLIQTYYKD